MHEARVRGALLAVCLACLLGSGFVLLRGRQPAPPPIVFTPAPAASLPPTRPAAGTDAPPAPRGPSRPARLYVDVAGSVRRPALYVLPKGSRVMQALLAAGGPARDADLDSVNLAEVITDGEKVYVPKRRPPVPGSLPSAAATARITAAGGAVPKPGRGKGSRGGAVRAAKITADSGEQVSLNSATLEQLERLPGVGPSMAQKILDYRQQSGGFQKIDDLSLVPGIGPKKLAKLTPFVTL